MKKKLNRVGYEVEMIHGNDCKVNVIYAGRILYFYLLNNKDEAIEKYNEIN